MAKEKIGIDKEFYSIQRLDQIINNFDYWEKIISRVYFIRYRFLGFSVAESAKKVGVSRGTGYNWQKTWNKSYDELFKLDRLGGPKSKLSDEDLEILKGLISDEMSVKDVKYLIKNKFDVDFTEKHVRTSIMERMEKLRNK